jgi:plastocyanin
MLSNHFPSTYGSGWAWAILAGIMVVGAAARHFENTGDRSPGIVFAVLGVILLVANSSLTSTGATAASGTGLPVIAAPSKGGPDYTPSGFDAKSLGTVKATVSYTGTPPAPKEVQIPSNCAPDLKGPVFDHKALVKDGKLQNAFVWIDEALDWKEPPPNDEVLVDQRACTYGPHVLGAQVGQRVTFLNSDPVFHNVRTIAKDNPPFNEAMATKDMRLTKTFGRPEIMVNAKCDVHPWMSSFIGVVAHPYYAVSNERGEVTLQNVPAGERTVAGWHELFGRVSAKVKVEAKETAKVELAFKQQ